MHPNSPSVERRAGQERRATHFTRPRVLIADDVDTARHIADMVTREEPYETVIVSDGQRALDAYREARENGRPFDLLVLDVEMPRLSGLGAAQAIRCDDNDQATPIALWTGEDSPMVEMRANSYHVNEIWQKCSEPERLAQNIRRILASSRDAGGREGTD